MSEAVNDQTRERILDSAELLFARKGFDAVSIREITGASKSNLAAVNYHFGSKFNLYMEVFRQRWVPRTRRIRKQFAERLADTPEPRIRDVVNAMVRSFLDGQLTDQERLIHGQLMQREIASPTDALKMVVEEVMRPQQQRLSDLMRPHLPAHVDENRLRLSLLSVIGVTLYFTFARPVVSRLTGQEYDDEFKAVLIDHITTFAIDGMNALNKEYN